VDHVVVALKSVVSEVVLVANAPDASAWLPDVAVLSDLHPGAGGLAGVEAALSGGRDAYVVAWDMPFVTGALLGALRDARQEHDADVVVPESPSPHGIEPFCAFYAATTLPRITAFLESGERAAHDLLAQLPRVHRLSAADVQRVGDPRRLFFSVNTDAELQRARTMSAGGR
jgi:molybdopterin-guanine dinucleotide biosynthesis protein A